MGKNAVKVKMADGSIEEGFALNIAGEMENKFYGIPMVYLPPRNKKQQDCGCLIFCKHASFCHSYDYREHTRYPFIIIYGSTKSELRRIIEGKLK